MVYAALNVTVWFSQVTYTLKWVMKVYSLVLMRQSRTDVAASTTEKQIMITYINDLLRFCRRVIAYIV